MSEARRAIPPGAVPWLAAGAALLAHVRSVGAGLVYDDAMLLAGNPYFRDLGNLARLAGPGYWESLELSWRPVATGVHLLEFAAFGGSAAALHAVSVAVHALCAGLLGRLLIVLGLAPGPALLGAALFAVHPAIAEAVTLASFREDLLATAFLLVGALLAARGPGGPGRATALGAATALALGSKESALAFPAIYAAVAWARGRLRPLQPWIPSAAACGLVLAAYLACRFGPMRNPAEAGVPPIPGGIPGLVAADLWILGEYARLLAWPATLCADRGLPETLPAAGVALGGVVLAAGLAAAWLSRRRSARVAAGLAWAGAALLPVSNLVPLSVPLAERFLHLPAVGLAWACAAAVPSRRGAAVAGAALVALLALRTAVRAGDFRDDETLARATLAANPRSSRFHGNLGKALAEKGDLAGAMAEHREAVRLMPVERISRLNLAACLQNAAIARLDARRPEEARPLLDEAVEVLAPVARAGPPDWKGLLTLGSVEELRGNPAMQAVCYEAALAAAPGRPEPRRLWARCLLDAGRPRTALAVLESAPPLVRGLPEIAALEARARAEAGR
ncbi:MAG: hypothetical protein L0216_06915 [Planctomycetales bacterium]|nr:hypothetical protein [Planctomycetales bacterium]